MGGMKLGGNLFPLPGSATPIRVAPTGSAWELPGDGGAVPNSGLSVDRIHPQRVQDGAPTGLFLPHFSQNTMSLPRRGVS